MTQTITIRTPADVIDIVPHLLGFEPKASLVVMTVGAFHARVDLPVGAHEVDHVANTLLEACLKHGVDRVLLAAYTEFGYDLERERLTQAFENAGVNVAVFLRVTDTHWYSPTGDKHPRSVGPLACARALDGSAPLPSREDLERSLDQTSFEITQRDVDAASLTVSVDHATARRVHEIALDSVDPFTRDHVDYDDATFLAMLAETKLRDVAWSTITRENARDHVTFWSEVVRETPRDGGAINAPAALLAFAAWLAGNGALAWCAVDLCSGDYRMGELIKGLLYGAVDPSTWQPLDFDDVLLAI